MLILPLGVCDVLQIKVDLLCDVDCVAVEWAMFGAFWTNGQICSATSRLLLQVNFQACMF